MLILIPIILFAYCRCNTDIKDDEIEINVLRGINLKGTDDLDTYVRVELPYPSVRVNTPS